MQRIFIALAALCTTVMASAAQEKTSLRMGVIANSSRSISQLGLYIAQRRGFFERENLDVKLVPLPGVQHQIAELDKGNVDVSHTATPYLIQAVLAGSDSAAIVGGLANPIFAVLAKPGINRLADLRGKTIGLSLPVDTITIGSLKLFARAGLGKSDFTTKELVGTPVRVDCLVNGACDAVPVGQPDDLVLMQKGYVNLGSSLDVIPALQFNVVAARRSWAAQNADVVTRYARAFANAYRYMNDPANHDDVASLITDTTGAAPDIAAKIMNLYFEPARGIMPKTAEINMAGMSAVVALMGEAGELKGALPDAGRFVELRYLREAGVR